MVALTNSIPAAQKIDHLDSDDDPILPVAPEVHNEDSTPVASNDDSIFKKIGRQISNYYTPAKTGCVAARFFKGTGLTVAALLYTAALITPLASAAIGAAAGIIFFTSLTGPVFGPICGIAVGFPAGGVAAIIPAYLFSFAALGLMRLCGKTELNGTNLNSFKAIALNAHHLGPLNVVLKVATVPMLMGPFFPMWFYVNF